MKQHIIKKVYKKDDWLKLLKDNLTVCPFHKGEITREYTPGENLIVKIKTKTSRNYTFGGPVWNGSIRTSNSTYLYLEYLSPLKKPCRVKWDNIKSICFRYISG